MLVRLSIITFGDLSGSKQRNIKEDCITERAAIESRIRGETKGLLLGFDLRKEAYSLRFFFSISSFGNRDGRATRKNKEERADAALRN